MAETITVNVADQGFPPPLPETQRLPQDLGYLTDGGESVTRPFVDIWQGTPRPEDIPVAGQAFLQPSFSQGQAVLEAAEVFPDEQQIGSRFPTEYTVMPTSGNFQTSLPDALTVIIASVLDADTNAVTTSLTQRLKITLVESLLSHGISFTGRVMEVLTGNVSNVGQIRVIGFWSVNVIYVNVNENGQFFLNGTQLAPGNTLRLTKDRDADEVTYNLLGTSVTAFPGTQEIPNQNSDVHVSTSQFQGNITPRSGVRTPFFGQGQQLPPFVGTFEVASQPVLGGLPTNVFV